MLARVRVLAPPLALLLAALAASPAVAQEEGEIVLEVPQEEAVARRVLAAPQVQKAMAYIDRSDEETVREWLSICNALGPSGDEIYRARHLWKLLRMYGLENVHIDDQRNVIGIRRGTGGGPTVVLNAHHDNSAIWPKDQPVEAFVADGRVWCPGAGDDLMGVTQVLTILRAMNAGQIQTRGDVWFVFLTGEEPLNDNASRGAELFVLSNYPHNIDWRKGDIMVQLHGGGGAGVSVGSIEVRHRSQLRVFVPVDRSEWDRHAVDALGPIITRISREVRDPRAASSERTAADRPKDLVMLNMAVVQAGNTLNQTVTEASVRFNMHALKEADLWRVHNQIMAIAKEECAKLGCTYHYSINSKNGLEGGIPGFDAVNSAAARMAVAASNVLYGTTGAVNPVGGCGDCVRAYRNGMPAFSLRGRVVDHGDGRVDRDGRSQSLDSEVRRKTRNHDPTTSAPVDAVWAAAKHGLLFAVSYAGLADTKAAARSQE
ncbi:MAG: M20/M25/M40 family metallo-hydrolase [Gemmatimonadetes bacterium]|nr:M20/M25/M40 family metallo-hydrolase [Gemmatimonadota bacterium]